MDPGQGVELVDAACGGAAVGLVIASLIVLLLCIVGIRRALKARKSKNRGG